MRTVVDGKIFRTICKQLYRSELRVLTARIRLSEHRTSYDADSFYHTEWHASRPINKKLLNHIKKQLKAKWAKVERAQAALQKRLTEEGALITKHQDQFILPAGFKPASLYLKTLTPKERKHRSALIAEYIKAAKHAIKVQKHHLELVLDD